MQIIKALFKESKGILFLASFISILSAASSTWLIALINESLNMGLGEVTINGYLFILGLGLTFLFGCTSQLSLNHFFAKIVYRLRMMMVARILISPLQQIEKLGGPKIYATLTKDIEKISGAYILLPQLTFNAAMIIGAIGYLYYLSPVYLLFLVITLGVGLAVCQLMISKMEKLFTKARETEDHLFKHFDSIVKGAKELKLNNQRSEDFYRKEMDGTTTMLKKLEIKTLNMMAILGNYVTLLVFTLIGGMIFLANQFYPQSIEVNTGYIMTILFLVDPIGEIMASISAIIDGNVALKKIKSFDLPEIENWDSHEFSLSTPTKPDWSTLTVENAIYRYDNGEEDSETFQLGPVNMELKSGEIIFIVGGNGSGKSTLAKLLTGLYTAQEGAILFDGESITDKKSEWYRNHFSSIFFDFFLFENLISADQTPEKIQQAEYYLERLRLNKKVTIKDGKLSTIDLSQGQRKRLALLSAYLEDRPLYLFDEWAADQDPMFKEFFYKEILPDLKRRNKTLLVISHDDRYFHIADRMFKLEDGQIESVPLQSLTDFDFKRKNGSQNYDLPG